MTVAAKNDDGSASTAKELREKLREVRAQRDDLGEQLGRVKAELPTAEYRAGFRAYVGGDVIDPDAGANWRSGWYAAMKVTSACVEGALIKRADDGDRDEPGRLGHQDVVVALRERIVHEAGLREPTGLSAELGRDTAGLAALVTAYTGTDPRESAEMSIRVRNAIIGAGDDPGGRELGHAVLDAIGIK
jgi:hypothetical protein